jgi:anti-sigma-K factor RskA
MNAEMKMGNGREPTEIELLLPWHAAGALNEREAQEMEAALSNDPDLARRYEWVRDELALETSISEALGEPSPRDMEALFARIEALPARRAASLDLAARIVEFFGSLSPRTLAWSAAAAAFTILLQVAVIADIVLNEKSSGDYQTASTPTSIAGEGSDVLLRFKPQTSAAEIADFLETNKFSIVGGPSAGGLYRARVSATKLAKPELMRIVKTLQDNKIVGFVAATD